MKYHCRNCDYESNIDKCKNCNFIMKEDRCSCNILIGIAWAFGMTVTIFMILMFIEG